MKRILRLIALLMIPSVLGACMGSEQFAGCSSTGRVCVDGVTTGSSVDGRRVTAWETSTPQGVSYAQETSTPLGGELAKIVAGSVLPAVINAGAGIAIADRQSCGGRGCGGGTQITVEGATAVAQSESVAQNHNQGSIQAGGFCLDVAPDGSCRQQQ